MAHVFTMRSKNAMLDSLNVYPNASIDGFSVHAYDDVNAGGTLLASEGITLGSASGAVRTMSSSPTLTIPASSTVKSISLATYDGTVSSSLTTIGYKNITPLVYVGIGTLTITALTISIADPS